MIESGDCGKADEESAVKRSLLPFEKKWANIDSKKQIIAEKTEMDHMPGDNSISEDGSDSEAKYRSKCGERCSDDIQLTDSQLDVELHNKNLVCSICMLGGKLLCCNGKGCNRSFHLSCVNPPFKYEPPGFWHCIWCVQKKMRFGVHSVSEGIESVFDVRDVDLNQEGQREKQYLVKYKSLAHVHNCWIPERELKETSPNFPLKKDFQNTRWKAEWALPDRLLLKRPLCFAKQCDIGLNVYNIKDLDCHYEWLVKWRGLGYDYATWELETAPFLNSPKAAKLMRDFESRHKNSKKDFCASRDDKERKIPSKGNSEKCPSGVHSQHASDISKLRNCWYERQSSVVFEDEERFVKMVSFISSLKDNNLPFLIISTSSSISEWKAEFSRHESSSVVVYKGNTDVRAYIRSLDFYNEDGRIMFQVMLCPPEVAVEDGRILNGIKWGAIIIDECQRPRISKHLNHINVQGTNTRVMRLLIVTDHIKDQRYLYNKLLCFINSELDGERGNASDSDQSDHDDNIHKLQQKLSGFIAYESKHQAPRFSEYWVPVQLSDVQLEQYCFALLSKSILLSSSSTNDLSNSLHELLVSERKCCNHPYLLDLDHSLRQSVTRDLPLVELLKTEVEMSGKLQLLDKFLSHIKEQGLRVLIVFQPFVGPGTISIGDILDDFVLQKFGKDSYARIDGGEIIPSRKQAALNLFNSKGGTQFVLLLEQRACASSLKLSSVDSVILFDSHWDPLNDLRALQKVKISSQFQQLKVFRLYSTNTVEEKVLILAKQGLALDNLQGISRKTCHTLLTWGAFHLFDKLDHLHGHNNSNPLSKFTNGGSFLNDVVSDFLALLPNHGKEKDPNTSFILKVQQNSGAYPKNISLHGELEAESMDGISLIQRLMYNEPSSVFWINLLKGRDPRWKFLSGSLVVVEREENDQLQEETESTKDSARRKQRMVKSEKTHLHKETGADAVIPPDWSCILPRMAKPKMKRKRSSASVGMSTKESARRKCSMVNSGAIHLKPKMKRKRRRYDEEKDISSAGSSLNSMKTHGISRKTRKKGLFGKKRGQSDKATTLVIKDIPASELIKSRLTKNQTQIFPVQGIKQKQLQLCNTSDLPSSECGNAIANVPIPRNIQNHQASRKKSHHGQGNFSVYSSQQDPLVHDDFDYTSILMPTIPAPLEQSIDVSRIENSIETYHTSQNMGPVVACNTQLPQSFSMSLEMSHSAVLDPQPQTELETMLTAQEEASKIREDTKLRLKAEFEKEIDEVAKRYLKLHEDTETEMGKKTKDLESYHKKVYESKLFAQAFTAIFFDGTEAEKFPRPQAARRSNARCEQSLAISPVTSASSSTCLSSHLPQHNSSAVVSPTKVKSTYELLTPRMSKSELRFGIQAPAPHLQHTLLSADFSPLKYPLLTQCKTRNSYTYTNTGSDGKTDSGNTLLGPENSMDPVNLSTSKLLHQLFTWPKLN